MKENEKDSKSEINENPGHQNSKVTELYEVVKRLFLILFFPVVLIHRIAINPKFSRDTKLVLIIPIVFLMWAGIGLLPNYNDDNYKEGNSIVILPSNKAIFDSATFVNEESIEVKDELNINDGLLYMVSLYNSRSETKITNEMIKDGNRSDYEWRMFLRLNDVPVILISNDAIYSVKQLSGDIDDIQENFMNFFLPMSSEFKEEELNKIFIDSTEGNKFKRSGVDYKGIKMSFFYDGQYSKLSAHILK